MDACVHTADSPCCTVKSNATLQSNYIPKKKYRWSPSYSSLNLFFFIFTMVQKLYAFCRNCTLNLCILVFFWFGSIQCDSLLWCLATAAATVPSEPWDNEGKQQLTTTLFSIFGTALHITYVRYSTLHYKTGFTLDNFTHCRTNSSV